MSERRSSADLGPDAEARLGTFPFPERDWESDARAIEARLSEASATNERLLDAPFPAEPGEPSGVSATTTPLTNSGVRTQSLTELARRSVEKKQAEAREIARASLAIAAAKKPTAEEARALNEALAGRAAAAPAAPSSSAVASSVVSVVASAPQSPVNRAAAAPSGWPKLALGVPLLALAAAALLWLRRPADPAPAPLANNALPSATSEAQAAPLAATNTGTEATPSAPNTPNDNGPSAPQGIDPNSLPSEPAVAKKPSEPAHGKALTASSATARAAADKVAASAQRPGANAAQTIEKSNDKTLPPDPALRPADSSGGELAAKPSTGAVQAALGAVMSGARHCVAGDDAPSSAVVSFGSDGRVQSVSVSGPAAGKASGACIQAQLTKARVQPFASSNFSVSATIRPD